MLYSLMKRFLRQLHRMNALIVTWGEFPFILVCACCRLLFSAYETASAALQRRNYASDDLALAIPFCSYDRYVFAVGNLTEFWIGAVIALVLSCSCSWQ